MESLNNLWKELMSKEAVIKKGAQWGEDNFECSKGVWWGPSIIVNVTTPTKFGPTLEHRQRFGANLLACIQKYHHIWTDTGKKNYNLLTKLPWLPAVNLMPNFGLTFNSNFRSEHTFSSIASSTFLVSIFFFLGEDSMFKIKFPITTSS